MGISVGRLCFKVHGTAVFRGGEDKPVHGWRLRRETPDMKRRPVTPGRNYRVLFHRCASEHQRFLGEDAGKCPEVCGHVRRATSEPGKALYNAHVCAFTDGYCTDGDVVSGHAPEQGLEVRGFRKSVGHDYY